MAAKCTLLWTRATEGGGMVVRETKRTDGKGQAFGGVSVAGEYEASYKKPTPLSYCHLGRSEIAPGAERSG